MDVLWTALEFLFWFAVAFCALAWLIGRMYEDDQLRKVGGVVYTGAVVLALGIAYAVVIHAPPQSECVEQMANGSGRC